MITIITHQHKIGQVYYIQNLKIILALLLYQIQTFYKQATRQIQRLNIPVEIPDYLVHPKNNTSSLHQNYSLTNISDAITGLTLSDIMTDITHYYDHTIMNRQCNKVMCFQPSNELHNTYSTTKITPISHNTTMTLNQEKNSCTSSLAGTLQFRQITNANNCQSNLDLKCVVHTNTTEDKLKTKVYATSKSIVPTATNCSVCPNQESRKPDPPYHWILLAINIHVTVILKVSVSTIALSPRKTVVLTRSRVTSQGDLVIQ